MAPLTKPAPGAPLAGGIRPLPAARVLLTWVLCAWAGLPLSLPALAGEPPLPQLIHQTSSPFYDSIFVIDENGLRSLRFNSATDDAQSLVRMGHPEELPMPYLRSAAVGLAVPENLQRILMIGLGGGAFPGFVRARLPGVYIDAVEIDPVVARIARDYFGLQESEKLTVHVMDAVDFVDRRREPYDLIFLDAYGADDIPEALTTGAFLEDVRANLARGGIAMANVAVSGTAQRRQVIRKLADPFYYCLQLRSPPRSNEVLLLSLQPLPSREALVDLARRFEKDSEVDLNLARYAETARSCFGPAQ